MDIAETLSSLQDQALETTKAVQDQVVEYVRRAVSAIDERLPEDRPALPFADSLPTAEEIIDNGFGFVESQHDFAKAIVDALAPLAPTVAKPAPVAKPKVAKAA